MMRSLWTAKCGGQAELSEEASQLLCYCLGRFGSSSEGVSIFDWLRAFDARFGRLRELMMLARITDGGSELARRLHESGRSPSIEDVLAAAAGVVEAREDTRIKTKDIRKVILGMAVEALGTAGREMESLSRYGEPEGDARRSSCEEDSCEREAGEQQVLIVELTDIAWGDLELEDSEDSGRDSGGTPLLDKLGRDLTRQAAEGELLPVLGRGDEIERVIETITRRTKRNPVLLGPAGVGKTTIVEGLALEIAAGRVPDPIRECRVYALEASVLSEGSGTYGALEQKINVLVKEASSPDIILFVDELHAIIGSGGRPGSGDLASLFKPHLAKGELALIGATTDDEYRKFIEKDKALERRFSPIHVKELSEPDTLVILEKLAERERKRGVCVLPKAIREIVRLAPRVLPERSNPDRQVDLFESCVARAISRGYKRVTVKNVEEMASRVRGAYSPTSTDLEMLRQELLGLGLPVSETDAILDRLELSLRGLAMKARRPRAVIMMTGKARGIADLPEIIASYLSGGGSSVISIDFSYFTDQYSVSQLLGSYRGLVGYDEQLPLHGLITAPRSVLFCSNVHASHPALRSVLSQALSAGYFTDSSGRRMPLSEAVVVLTAELAECGPKVGFDTGNASSRDASVRESASREMGSELMDLVNVIVTDLREVDRDRTGGAEAAALESLRRLCIESFGLSLSWDKSVPAWLARRKREASKPLEMLVEEEISCRLIGLLDKRPCGGNRGEIHLEEDPGGGLKLSLDDGVSE